VFIVTIVKKLSRSQQIILTGAMALVVAAAWPKTQDATPAPPSAPVETITASPPPDNPDTHAKTILALDETPDIVAPEPTAKTLTHEVADGDTLSGLFSQLGLSSATLNAILSADQELLALDVLRPGNRLQFQWTGDGTDLAELSLTLRPGRVIHYRRGAEDTFEFEDDVSQGQWQERVLAAPIEGSFYASASRAGLSDADIVKAERIFKQRVNFRREIKAGNRFDIVLEEEHLDGSETTGQTRIAAIRLQVGKRVESAFLHDDGSYYDAKGESLHRAFLRYPTRHTFRVSSPFNMHRLHPVTKRVAPHHGVDFATPMKTPIMTIGDGIITRIGDHPYAGKYVEIEHPGQFKTRYLHLSRVMVKQGQSVQRGQKIALSGNTGRTTGPHLHFELHVNNRPVNPLTADIPSVQRIPSGEMLAFTSKVKSWMDTMERAEMTVARHDRIRDRSGDS
jgi:murein DD-endopeptidase